MHAEQTKGGFNIAGTKGALTPTRPIQSRGRQRNRSRPGSWTGGSSQASHLITLIFLARTPHNKSKKREGKPNFVKPRAILAIFSHSCKATRYDFQFEGAPSSAKSLQSWAISCCILPLYPGAPKIFPIISYIAMPLALPRFGAVENCVCFSLFAVSCVRHTYMLKMPYQIRR